MPVAVTTYHSRLTTHHSLVTTHYTPLTNLVTAPPPSDALRSAGPGAGGDHRLSRPGGDALFRGALLYGHYYYYRRLRRLRAENDRRAHLHHGAGPDRRIHDVLRGHGADPDRGQRRA